MPRARAPFGAASVVAVAALALGLAAPSVDWLDSGNLTASAWSLGVAHPPGEPAWLAAARIAQWLPLGDIAFRATLLSVGTLAAAAAALAAMARRLAAGDGAEIAAGLAVLLGLSSYGAQLQAVRAEVYAPVTALLLSAMAAALLRAGPRASAAAGGLLGLAAGVHPLLAAAAAPAVAVARWMAGPLRARDLAAGLGAGVLPLLVLAWLPLRAAAAPERAWGVPDSPGRLVDTLLARDFARNFGEGGTSPGSNMAAIGEIGLAAGLPLLGLLALAGLRRLWAQPGGRALLAAVPLWLLGNVATVATQNKVFASNPDAWGYLLPGAALLAVPAAVGATELYESLRLRWRGPTLRGAAAALVATLALSPLPSGLAASRAGNFLPRSFAAGLAGGLPPGAVLMVSGNDSAFAWAWLRQVEHYRDDLVLLPRVLLGHEHERRRLGAPELLRARTGLPWEPALRERPLRAADECKRPFFLEIREEEREESGRGLRRHGLVAQLQGCPRTDGPAPEPETGPLPPLLPPGEPAEPPVAAAIREAWLAEAAAPRFAGDAEAALVRAYWLSLWETAP